MVGNDLGVSVAGFVDEAEAHFAEIEVKSHILVSSVMLAFGIDIRDGMSFKVGRVNIVVAFKREGSVQG